MSVIHRRLKGQLTVVKALQVIVILIRGGPFEQVFHMWTLNTIEAIVFLCIVLGMAGAGTLASVG